MRKLLIFLIFIGGVHACSSIYFSEEKNPPKAQEISKDYTPKSIKNPSTRNQLVKEGEKLIGTKYRYGGTTPKGFDCSGFTGYVYDKVEMNISRSSSAQAKLGKEVPIKKALPGDLIFFTGTGRNKISHVAMVVSNDKEGLFVIHSTTSKGVRKDNISTSTYWKPKMLFVRQIIE